MLWWAEADAVRDYLARLRSAGGVGPVAVAMRLAQNTGRWLELTRAYAEAGADLLILTGYGHRSRLTEELEQFGAEVLPRLSDLVVSG